MVFGKHVIKPLIGLVDQAKGGDFFYIISFIFLLSKFVKKGKGALFVGL